MILVTVGMHNQGFDRLVKAMDDLSDELEEEVIIQYGSSSYHPRFARSFQWATSQQMEQLTAEARVVITHAAAGAIIFTLLHRKPMVLVPRLPEFGEVIDDHQRQLAVALSEQGRAVYIAEPTVGTLKLAIERALSQNMTCPDSSRLTTALRQQLSRWDRNSI